MDRVAIIKACFEYNPETGAITDKTDPNAKGWLNNGYMRYSCAGWFQIYAHQIAFAIMTGVIPIEIDHEDRNRTNNIWVNLRECPTHSHNAANVNCRSTSKTKIKGVSWSKSNRCWRMDIQWKQTKYHSYHANQDDARVAYCLMSEKLHGKFGNAS